MESQVSLHVDTCCLNLAHWITKLTQRVTACATASRFFYVSAKRRNSDQLKFPSSSDLFRQHVGHHYKRTLFYERESIILVFIAC